MNEESKGNKPNYVVVGKGGEVYVVSGATGQISALEKAQADQVLELVRARQKIGKQLAAFLNDKGLVLTDEVVIDIEG